MIDEHAAAARSAGRLDHEVVARLCEQISQRRRSAVRSTTANTVGVGTPIFAQSRCTRSLSSTSAMAEGEIVREDIVGIAAIHAENAALAQPPRTK